MSKSPSYQWYPKDVLTDKMVEKMTLEQEAVYRRLLDYAWLENGLDDDMDLLASYSKMRGQTKRFLKVWEVVKKCFRKRSGRWHNPRQKKLRLELKVYSDQQRIKANIRWGKGLTEDATAMPRHPSGNALHLQSPSASALEIKSDLNHNGKSKALTQKQEDEIFREVVVATGFPVNSEAAQIAFRELIDRVKNAKKVGSPFAYAIKAAKNLKPKEVPA